MNKYLVIPLLSIVLICAQVTSVGVILASADSGYNPPGSTSVWEIYLAYIDPGSAGFIITTVLGFIAAVGYTIRLYYHRLKASFLFRNQKNEKDASSDEQD